MSHQADVSVCERKHRRCVISMYEIQDMPEWYLLNLNLLNDIKYTK